ncbi:UDP-glucose--hexose-1-phosphate uridylyltransferase [Rheinheimera sp. 4Y26]|uniref:UDP-glucose--hexose-1-phosphate uridylyltransferase n=1 Tax=Rheinheimera sp. 4Y26 TaxID=2977811 RepID=UPI0021B0A444|nr:UDP-glucose--hexose-1-phosphate uridylyltransferase [Rheinheimera sp. 4Y26]MCT6698626.1 UDP-glucose--hexose-1-phosphate uridylyltransferase [Rheinheimera sp. 4Y26]
MNKPEQQTAPEQLQPVFMQHEHPHRRFNPLTGDWVLVSPHRAKRPWQGQLESTDPEMLPSYDPECYLCAGNLRISGERNPNYRSPFVFTNDFAALKPDGPGYQHNQDDLFRLQSVQGTSRVICYSPDHSKTLPELSQAQIVQLIQSWIDQYRQLSAQYRWVQVFENKGAINGCSNPHPHGQIWASNFIPTLPAKADKAQRRYLQQHGKNLLLHYAHAELQHQERLVLHNEHWLVVVPYWASWPFETLLLPKAQVARMEQLSAAQQLALADILQRLTSRYDNLFQCAFPYSMGWHGAPYPGRSIDEQELKAAEQERSIDQQQRSVNEQKRGLDEQECCADETQHWQLHAHFYPPLLRSASIKKFMVGYEMLAETQRDMTPEQAAERLRNQSDIHYKKQMVEKDHAGTEHG